MAQEIYFIELEQDGLHTFLSKGLPKGSMALITGENGTGKSAICQRLAFGFLRHNYSITYISTELTTKGFIDQMGSLNYPILDELLLKKLTFVPVFPLIGKVVSRNDFLTRLLSGKELYNSDIIIIDTFSSLVKEDISEEKALQAIAFFKKLAGRGHTMLLTIDPMDLPEKVLSPFQSVSDIFITLKTRVVGGTIEHTMHVNRFGGAKGHVGDIIGFRIEAGAGFIVDITTVA